MVVLGEDDREVLVRDLRTLVSLGPRLEDLVVPSVAASGSNAGVTASVPGPRDPVRSHPFEVEHTAAMLLGRIIRAVRHGTVLHSPRWRGVGVPPVDGVLSVATLAGWLLDHVEELAGHEDVADAVAVIGQQARRVADLVEPPVSEREQLRARGVEVRDPVLSWGTERAVVEGAALRGHRVGRTTVRGWADVGAVRSLSVPGQPRKFSFEDVLAMCAGKDERAAETRRVTEPGGTS